MKAIRLPQLALADVADPVEGVSEVRVKVRACGVNRADLLQAKGLYPAPPDAPADIPGLEYAGEVIAVGSQVRRFKAGDRVMGIVGGGAYSEQLAVHERTALKIPDGMGFVDAAAIPEAFMTAFDALVLQADLRSGETVLIHAVASGVGTAAAQIARALEARVCGTVRSASKIEACRALGVEVNPELHGEAQVILDLVGASLGEQSLEAAAPRARWLCVGLLGGAALSLDLSRLLRKRLRLIGTVLRSRPLEEKIAVTLAFEQQMLPLFERKRLTPIVARTVPSARVQDAFDALTSNQTLGKVILTWD
ncbi:MAG: NAD(P)H-quinone oxidoreductase [Myxococcaceae bacterium]